MKTFKTFFFAILCLIFFNACDKSSNDLISGEDLSQNLKAKKKGNKGIPFKADFYTIRNYDSVSICTKDPYISFNYQVGEGAGTHLGKFTTTMSFCGDNTTFTYKNGEGVFIAANGDELYYWIPSPDSIGHIIPIVHSVYEFQFQDPFTFNGGTGRFEGASGGGYTNSFVDLFDDEGNFIPEHRTDHVWTGTLILPKKNK